MEIQKVSMQSRERETDPGRQVFSETGVVKTDAEDDKYRKEREEMNKQNKKNTMKHNIVLATCSPLYYIQPCSCALLFFIFKLVVKGDL